MVPRRTQYCVQLEPKRAIRSLSKTSGCVGAEELLYADDVDKVATSWSSDGKWLLYDRTQLATKTGRDVWALPMEPEQRDTVLKPSPCAADHVKRVQCSILAG